MDVHVPRAVEQVTEVAEIKEMSVLGETIEEKMVRVETLEVEVEKMRSELFEAERAGERRDPKPRPNLAACGGSDSRCSCAGEGKTVGGSAEDHIS